MAAQQSTKADTSRPKASWPGPTPDATVVVLPTYNERESLPVLLPRILAHGPEWHVLVADDASPDGTGQLADSIAGDDHRVRVLHRTGPRGLGLAYRDGLALALAAGFEFVFTMDSDLSHDPRALPGLRDLARGHGAAVGSRYVPGGGAEEWSWMRRLNSYSVNLLTRLVLGLHVRDTSTGFRCFRRDVLAEIDPRRLIGEGYSIMEELSFRAERAGFRYGEYPIIFVGRRMGSSKTSLKQGLDVLRMLVRLRFGASRGDATRQGCPPSVDG